MLVAASDGLALVQADAPQDRQLVPARLAGRPTAATPLSDRLAVVACSSGQLLLLDVHRLGAAPVAAGLLSAAPTCLAFLPAPGDEAAQAAAGAAGVGLGGPAPPAGLLFVGSSSGGSAFLQLPAWRAAPAGDAAQLTPGVAPVSSARLFEDDCGDRRLLACCGQPPHARLAVGHLAAGLSPLAAGGGDLPVSTPRTGVGSGESGGEEGAGRARGTGQGVWDTENSVEGLRMAQQRAGLRAPSGTRPARTCACSAPPARLRKLCCTAALPLLQGLVRLLGLRASPSAPCHRYLLLSCDAPTAAPGTADSDGWTLALEAEAGGLRPATLPGLQPDAATLLAGPLPGGALLQVTPRVRLGRHPCGARPRQSCAAPALPCGCLQARKCAAGWALGSRSLGPPGAPPAGPRSSTRRPAAVTQGARLFRPAGGAPVSCWSPPVGAHVSLAAQQGQYVALACGAVLQVGRAQGRAASRARRPGCRCQRWWLRLRRVRLRLW